MSDDLTIEGNKFHFIGIGGVGMSGLARICAAQGGIVSGSDIKESRFTEQLEKNWIDVEYGHRAENIPDGDVVVVVSSAIQDDNPELISAKERGLTIIHRAKMLELLGKNLKTLAVAGTHGKTTTSSMLACTLDDMGEDPTFVIGGMVLQYGTNARPGTGDFYVVEADESDKSLTCIKPYAAIVTSIESDHLDHYKSINEIYDKFAQFFQSLEPSSPCVVSAEDEKLVALAKENAENVITYGFKDTADVRIISSERLGVGSAFSVKFPDGRVVSSKITRNPGSHNELNATAVLALVDALGLDVEDAAKKLSNFEGVHRRFELVGRTRGITVIDDYAHHPTEIAATIKAAKALDFRRIHVIFQPHRYSRYSLLCEVLKDEFAHAFDLADTLVFTDVYAAGETPTPGVNGQTFLNTIIDNGGKPNCLYVPRLVDVPEAVKDLAEPGDLIMTMGAGDITGIGTHILESIKRA